MRGWLPEVGGGGAAAAVILTQSMAFGVALYEPYVGSAGAGAAAGLVCAVALNLGAGIARGTTGMVSAPTGPVLVMLAAIAGHLSSRGLHGPDVISALAVVIILAGLAQCLIGLVDGGQVVKLVPVSIIAGFMTGSGILMMLSQLEPALGGASSLVELRDGWLPLATAGATLGSMHLGRHWWSRIPPVVPGMVAGCAVFHGLGAVTNRPLPEAWLVGGLPRIDELTAEINFPDLGALPWGVVAIAALVLAVFTSLDTLLTSLVADTETESRHDARRELVGQGLGHVLSGFAGGTAGAGTTAATVVAIRNGGQRGAGVICAVVVLACVVWAREATVALPVSVLAGIIFYVALGLLEPDIIAWWQRRRTRTDALIALLVAGVTVAWDLMLAVALGVVITVIRFVVAQVRAPVVQRRSTGPHSHSQRARDASEQQALDSHGERVVLYELRGSLVFATVERLFEEIQGDIDDGKYIVLSLRRVGQVDLTGANLLRNMAARATLAGGEIAFANVYRRSGLGRKVHKTFRRIGSDRKGPRVRTFKSSDVALEYFENKLLDRLGMRSVRAAVPLERSELCADMTGEHVARLAGYMTLARAERGHRIYEVGKLGGTLYVVLQGHVDIRLPTGRHHWSRLARLGPGMVFGEVSFHTPGPHTATAVATGHCELFTLTRDAFVRLSEQHPAVVVSLLGVVGRVLGRRLRQANDQIAQLNRF